MKTERSGRLWTVLVISATSGVVGAAVGSYITGDFQIESQKVAAEKDIKIAASCGSRELGAEFREAASEYFGHALTIGYFSRKFQVDGTYCDRVLEFLKRSHQLALLVGAKGSSAVVKCTRSALNLGICPNDDPRRAGLEREFSNAIRDAYGVVRSESANLRSASVPVAGISEEFVQMACELASDFGSRMPVNVEECATPTKYVPQPESKE